VEVADGDRLDLRRPQRAGQRLDVPRVDRAEHGAIEQRALVDLEAERALDQGRWPCRLDVV
jgi:hypothetical protein